MAEIVAIPWYDWLVVTKKGVYKLPTRRMLPVSLMIRATTIARRPCGSGDTAVIVKSMESEKVGIKITAADFEAQCANAKVIDENWLTENGWYRKDAANLITLGLWRLTA